MAARAVRGGAGMESPRVLRVLAVVFTVAAAGALVLVVLDLVIGRPAAGDVFIAVLNAWRHSCCDAGCWHKPGHEERPAAKCRPFRVSNAQEIAEGNQRRRSAGGTFPAPQASVELAEPGLDGVERTPRIRRTATKKTSKT
jgi:hypothetical protein